MINAEPETVPHYFVHGQSPRKQRMRDDNPSDAAG